MKKIAAVVLLLLLAGSAWAQSGQVSLNAAGASFPYPIYSKWFDEYHKLHPNI
jgi:phosphate transport system substrate-binding protein